MGDSGVYLGQDMLTVLLSGTATLGTFWAILKYLFIWISIIKFDECGKHWNNNTEESPAAVRAARPAERRRHGFV